jgi:hypothetical protein
MADEPTGLNDLVTQVEKTLESVFGQPMVARLKRAVMEGWAREVPAWATFTDPVEKPTPSAAAADSALFEMRVKQLVAHISYKVGYRLICERDKKDPDGRLYLQVECDRPDVETKQMGVGRGGKFYLSEHMTDGEILRRAFSLFQAYEEHECREWFQYKHRALFGPHIDPMALWEVADRLDYRS